MLELYRVEWTKLETPEIGQREREFLAQMETDDGTFLVSEDSLDQAVADWEETLKDMEEANERAQGDDSFVVPTDLVEYLREQLSKDGEHFSVAVL